MYFDYIKTTIGNIKVVADETHLISCYFFIDEEILESMPNSITSETVKQLNEYFEGNRKEFDLPIKLDGTEFQIKCWQSLLNIPYGETRSYQEQAISVGNIKAVRAVGGANNKNKIGIVIPCHRVIGKDGSLTGFFSGVEHKKYLLDLEEKNK